MNNLDIYEIKSIIDSQALCGRQKLKYLVKWKGQSHEYNTKEPVEHLKGSEKAI